MEHKNRIIAPIVIAVLVVASLVAVIMPATAPSSDTGSECSSCADTSPPPAPPNTPEESETECQSCTGLMSSSSPLLLSSTLGGGDPGAGCIANTTSYNGTIKGGVYFEQQGWSQYNIMTRTFDNVPSNIKIAKVFTGVWQGSPGKGGFFNITIQNATSSYTTDTYKACDPCPGAPCAAYQSLRCDALNASINNDTNWNLDKANMHDYIVGCGVQFISFNATPYITPGSNTITVKTAPHSCTAGGWDGRVYVIALLVVYENSSMPDTTYWLNEGALYLEKGSYCDGPEDHLYASKYFNGSHVSNPAKVKLWTLGWPHVINATEPPAYTKLNGNNIGYPDITESYADGYNEVLLRWNNIPTGYLDATSNFLEYYDPDPLYERAFAEVLIVEGPGGPDLTVSDLEFPTVMRPDKTYTITATVKNEGGEDAGAFNASLKAERGGTIYYNGKKPVPGGLAAGASTPVSFTDVNLPAGCYNFTAKADCDNTVNEANEDNNERTEKYQVGNVIVVNSNSDFDALVTEGFATKAGDTYYIQNLTITNCAGSGSTIKNTDVPFVIMNCTVHSCLEHGINIEDAKSGKINESEAYGSGLKGIRMQNSSYMLVDHNYVHDNADYGVDIYMKIMPYLDSHNITVSNNTLVRNMYGIELMGLNCTVRDNVILNSTAWAGGVGGYGIYVAGNNSKIYNNTIKYSDNYAMKVDNDWPSIPTYDNCIVGNNFIENNRLIAHTSQAYDSGINYWNTTRKIGYYYNGIGPSFAHDNHTGNNWSDYTGSDSNNDGIGDSPYNIAGGTMKDNSPLMKPWVNYTRIKCGDVDCIGGITYTDVLKLNKHNTDPSYELKCCTGCPS